MDGNELYLHRAVTSVHVPEYSKKDIQDNDTGSIPFFSEGYSHHKRYFNGYIPRHKRIYSNKIDMRAVIIMNKRIHLKSICITIFSYIQAFRDNI